jgi:hypothetical protein
MFSGNWSVRDWNSISVVMLEDTIENDCNFYSFLTIQQLFQNFWNKRHTLSVNIGTYSKTSQNNLFFYLFNTCTNKFYIFVQCTYTVDSRLELGLFQSLTDQLPENTISWTKTVYNKKLFSPCNLTAQIEVSPHNKHRSSSQRPVQLCSDQ